MCLYILGVFLSALSPSSSVPSVPEQQRVVCRSVPGQQRAVRPSVRPRAAVGRPAVRPRAAACRLLVRLFVLEQQRAVCPSSESRCGILDLTVSRFSRVPDQEAA